MAEKMMVLEKEAFHLEPNREEVYQWLRLQPQLPVWKAFDREWERALALFGQKVWFRGFAWLRGESEAAVFLTLGGEVDRAVEQAFAQGQYVLASLLNTLADQSLFQMDMQAGRLLEERWSLQGKYIGARTEAPMDYPLERQRALLAEKNLPGVTVYESGLFQPTKSLLYCLAITNQPVQGQSTHDCSRCEKTNCPYRGYRR